MNAEQQIETIAVVITMLTTNTSNLYLILFSNWILPIMAFQICWKTCPSLVKYPPHPG